MDSIKKSKYPLAPIYEAITNSLEAIFQKEYRAEEKPEITVTFDFTGLLENEATFSSVTIQDNGIGFNDENYKRFETLLDKSKGYNNRGSGRIQYVHRFIRVEVESYFLAAQELHKRNFVCNATQFITSHSDVITTEPVNSGSRVVLLAGDSLGSDQSFYDSLKLTDIVKDLRRHFLLRYYLDSETGQNKAPVINIVFTKNGHEQDRAVVKPEDMPKPSETGELSLQYLKLDKNLSDEIKWTAVQDKSELMKWAHFKLSDKDLAHNSVYLCSKGVTVEPVSFDGLRKNEAVDGHRYLTAFYGDVLDDDKNVSHSVDSFRFPDRKKIEAAIKEGDLYLPHDEFLFSDTIKKEINGVIPGIYKDILDIQKTQDNAVEQIAKDHAISLDIAKKANIRLSDSEEKITEKLYRAQAEELSKENRKIQQIFQQLNTLNPTDENYQNELEGKSKELLNLIPRQNKEELGRYVIRREMVAEVLRKILSKELVYQNTKPAKGKRNDKEGLVHDLIFKRKSKNTEPLNDLWILSEEYVHFEGCSDQELNKITDSAGQNLLRYISDEELTKYGIKSDRRPDIFLFASERKCVLIELKAPDVDLSDHLQQMIKYCSVIANYSAKNIQSFYCYLIGENINPIDLDGEYKETFLGDWMRPHIPIVSFGDRKEIASAHMEIIKLSSIYARAHRRNHSFADKLGLRDILKD